MASNNKVSNAAIDFGTINNLLLLDETELLEQVVQVLHQSFGTYSTSIVEIDKLHYSARILADSCEHSAQRCDTYSLSGTPCEQVVKSEQLFFLYPANLKCQFPCDKSISQNNIVAYLGIPLRAKSGEVLGLLLSKFQQQLLDTEEVIRFHKILANVVVHRLRVKWLSERSEYLVHQLSYEVSHDNLTGLMNRSCLADKLEVLTSSMREPFTLVYVDINSFKLINDMYGNYIGDQVIKYVAGVLTSVVHDEHLSFRIAGDEFAFVTFSQTPFEICKLINEQLEQGYLDASRSIKLSVSFGLARKVEQYINPDQLILNASLALKAAKQSNSSHIYCYDTELSAQYYRRTMIIDSLRAELDSPVSPDSEVYVVLQPIVNKGDQIWNYFEVLVRWRNQALGKVSPLELISAAEQSGLIVELGERITELACQAKQVVETGLGYQVKLALNCSANQLADPTRYLGNIVSTIKEYGFQPSEFTIELTETILLTQTQHVKLTLDKLRALGFRVALDDFGTGYSSLNYIHNYPIDCIKIDATFIQNMLQNKTSERVVWLIVQLAQQLDLLLVAEGVESQSSLDKLYEMGCEQIQGFYFSRPETPQAIVDKLTPLKELSNVING